MGKLLAVIKREYLERVRTKWFIITTVFGPVFFLGISVVPGLLTVRNMRSAQVTDFRILDATGIGLGERVSRALRERQEEDPLRKVLGTRDTAVRVITETKVEVVAPDRLAAAESLATRAVVANDTRGYLVLDSATVATAKARYAGRNASSLGEMNQVEGALRTAILSDRLARVGITGPRADSLTRVKVSMATERMDEKGRGGSGLVSAIFGFLIAFLLYMMIILYGQNILRGVLDTLRSVDANLGVTSADEVLAMATEPLITRNIIVVEQDRYRVRERNVLRYYARSIAHLLSPPSSTH